MKKVKEENPSKNTIHNLNVIDLILIDHRFLKECIGVLTGNEINKRQRMATAKCFLSAITAHSQVEKAAVYTPLESNEELHFNIIQSQIDHNLMDEKVKHLQQKLFKARSLKEEVQTELKILIDLVKNHISEEENEVLPKMQREIDDATLTELGRDFMKLRKFSAKDLKDYPHVQDELIQWKDSIQKVSSEFLTRMDKFVENTQH